MIFQLLHSIPISYDNIATSGILVYMIAHTWITRNMSKRISELDNHLFEHINGKRK